MRNDCASSLRVRVCVRRQPRAPPGRSTSFSYGKGNPKHPSLTDGADPVSGFFAAHDLSGHVESEEEGEEGGAATFLGVPLA